MSDDDGDFMKNWVGAGTETNIPVINPAGGAYCELSKTAGAIVKTVEVTFDYEAWFTGDIQPASLALGVKNVDSKLLGYLASAANLCDGIQCTANSADCVDIYNKARQNVGIVGISKNSTDIIQTKYVCEQPKPVKQLPLFDRIVCIPVTAKIYVSVPSKLNTTEVQTSVWNSIKNAMDTGDLNTPNQVVGLVFTGTPHNKLNVSGQVKKEMRPLGKGLLSFGVIFLTFIIAGLAIWRVMKRRRACNVEEDDDLSLKKEKDEEGSYAPTDSFMSDDAPVSSPTHEAHAVDKSHSMARQKSDVSWHSSYPVTKTPSVIATSHSSVNKNDPQVQLRNDEEFEVNQFFCCAKS